MAKSRLVLALVIVAMLLVMFGCAAPAPRLDYAPGGTITIAGLSNPRITTDSARIPGIAPVIGGLQCGY